MSITLCTITGNVENILGTNVSGVTISATVLTPFIHPTNGSVIVGQIGQATSDGSGNFSITCIETTTAGVGVRFTFSYFDGISATKQKYWTAVVPNQSAITFSALINSQTTPNVLQTFPAAQVSLATISGIVATNVQAAVAELYADMVAQAGVITLTGDVTASGVGTVPATVVSVGGASAASVATASNTVSAATALNTVSTLVLRDSSGNFAAGTITAALTGTASGNTTYTANNHGVVLSGSANTMAVLAPSSSTAFPLVSGGSSANPSWALLGVAGGGTGLASGTSGGVLAYTASGTLASSGALTANQLVIGGGAGVAPSSLAAGSQFQVLRMGASNPAYGSIALNQAAAITGTLGTGNGGTGVASVTTAATASSFAGWDANSNLSANNFLPTYRTTATAAATTTLVVGDAYEQYFTGVTTQTCKLPVASTLVNGQTFRVTNLSSGVVTVQTSGANTVQAMAQNTVLTVTCINTGGGTGTASWNWFYGAVQGGLGGTGTVTSVTFTGDGTILSSTPSSAVTTSGTVTASLNTQTANTVLAGPTSGSAAAPTARALVSADYPVEVLNNQTPINLGLATSVGASALTIALKQNDGSTNASAAHPVLIPFRSTTATTGSYVRRAVTAALSIVVASTVTLGTVSALPNYIWVYAIDNAGTIELGVSLTHFDDGVVQNTTHTQGNAPGTLYNSGGADLSGVAIRLIGVLLNTQATAGTWASAGTTLWVNPNPQSLNAILNVSAKYDTSTTTVSSNTVLNYTNKIWDTHNAVTTGASWKFVAPLPGKYRMYASFVTGASNYSAGDTIRVSYGKAGSAVNVLSQHTIEAAVVAKRQYQAGGIEVALVPGDDIQAVAQSGSSTTPDQGTDLYITIDRIGD